MDHIRCWEVRIYGDAEMITKNPKFIGHHNARVFITKVLTSQASRTFRSNPEMYYITWNEIRKHALKGMKDAKAIIHENNNPR